MTKDLQKTVVKDLMRAYCKTVDIRKFGYFSNTKHSVTKFSIIPLDSAFLGNLAGKFISDK